MYEREPDSLSDMLTSAKTDYDSEEKYGGAY